MYIKHNNITAATRTFKPGSKGEELVPEMKVVSDNIFVKTKSNALTSEAFSAFIAANGINEFYVAGADATGCVSILIDAEGRNMIAVAPGVNLRASSEAVDDKLMSEASLLLLQMENDPSEIARLIHRAKRGGVRAVLNLAPALPLPHDALSSCSLVVVNEDEAEALGNWLRCEPTVEDLSRRLQTGVVRTLSGNGAEAVADGEKISVAAIKVDVKDTTAAGDCFVAR